MSEDQTGVPPSDGSVAGLNQQQAMQLLDIDRMLARQRWSTMPFGWERLATASCCYRALEVTDLFGESASDDISGAVFRLPYRNMASSVDYFWLAGGHHEASFAQSAAFLGIVSDWGSNPWRSLCPLPSGSALCRLPDRQSRQSLNISRASIVRWDNRKFAVRGIRIGDGIDCLRSLSGPECLGRTGQGCRICQIETSS